MDEKFDGEVSGPAMATTIALEDLSTDKANDKRQSLESNGATSKVAATSGELTFKPIS